jgi:hypothetical protein
MKWKWLGLAAVCGLVLAGASMSLRAERKEKPVRTVVPEPIAVVPSANVPSAEPPHAKTSKDQAAADLVAIIKETESHETFMLALTALAALKPNDKTILPLAIRNADRLGMTEGMFKEKPSEEQEALENVFELLLGDQAVSRPRWYDDKPAKTPGCVPAPPALVPSVNSFGPAPNPPMGPVTSYSIRR